MSGQQSAQASSAMSKAADNLLTEAVRLNNLGKALLTIIQAYERNDGAAAELLREAIKCFSVKGSGTDGESDAKVSFVDSVKSKVNDIIKWVQENILPKKTPEQIVKDQERVYDPAMQDTVFDLLKQDRFSKNTWNNATLEERKEILSGLMNEVATAMGITVPRQFLVGSMDDNSTVGFFSYDHDLTAINEYYLDKKDSYKLI